MSDYEGMARVCYGEEKALFLPVCPKCGRFVKADAEIRFNEEKGPIGENASCSKCGRIEMPFEGYGE